jgi:uncharacterized protein YkwD
VPLLSIPSAAYKFCGPRGTRIAAQFILSLFFCTLASATPQVKGVRLERVTPSMSALVVNSFSEDVIESSDVKLDLTLPSGVTLRNPRLQVRREMKLGRRTTVSQVTYQLRGTIKRGVSVLQSGLAPGRYLFSARLLSGRASSRWSRKIEVRIVTPEPFEPTPSPGESPTPPPTPTPLGPPVLSEGFSSCGTNADLGALFTLVNEARVALGLGTLIPSSALENGAVAHSLKMAQDGFLSHDGFLEAISRYGFSGSDFGQNVANMYQTPVAVFNGWRSSSGHWANITRASYTAMGVGCVLDRFGVPWWTQNFSG